MSRFQGRKFRADFTREELEKFVRSWLISFNLHPSSTFEVRDVYYHYLDWVPTLTNYLERFLKVQLEDGVRSWVVITKKLMSDIHRKYVDFYYWESCKGVGTKYRLMQ